MLKKIKILYVVSTLQRGGPTNQLFNIISNLNLSKFSPTILTLSNETNDSMKGYFSENLTVPIVSAELSRRKDLLFGRKKLFGYIKELDPDIVHAQGFRADSLLRKIKIPKISTLRNFPFLDYPLKYGRIKGFIMAKKHFSIVKKAPYDFFACSKFVSDQYKSQDVNVSYVQNGVDTNKFKPLENNQRINLKIDLKVPVNKRIVIAVNSLIPRKNVLTIIEGFKLFNKANDNLLYILGEGPLKKELVESKDNSIIFLGKVPNVVDYLQISDIYVSAALSEGLPNGVLEALACGLPCCLSEIPSHKEILDFNFRAGILFSSLDVEDLANSLGKAVFLNGLDSLYITKNHLSAQRMSLNYQDIYINKLINRK